MFNYVFSVSENGKNYAYAVAIGAGDNLLAHIKRVKNLAVVHQCETKKYARSLAAFWNDCYKENGTYMFADAPAF